jgi:hypothetical protein
MSILISPWQPVLHQGYYGIKNDLELKQSATTGNGYKEEKIWSTSHATWKKQLKK